MYVKIRKRHRAYNEPGWIDEEEQNPFIFEADQVVQIIDQAKPETTRYFKVNTLRGIRYVDGSLSSLPRPTKREADDA